MVPVIIWANGIISKSFRKYLNNVPRKHDINELQKRGIWALRAYFGTH